MDIPSLYKNKDRKQILEFLQNQFFGLLVSQGEEHPEASHLPYTIRDEEGQWYLYSHMRGNNRHTSFLEGRGKHLFVVQGVDHYISSTWYDHENVPTWNYISVHVLGALEVQTGAEALENIKQLMDRLEPPEQSIRSMDKLDPGMIAREMKGLLAFRMKVEKIEAAKKLSQNRDETNYINVIRELDKLKNPRSTKMADEMRRNNPFHSHF